MSTGTGKSTFHAVVFPFLAVGHLTPFLHLSNKLAEKGNKISFICPPKTIFKLESLNLYPNLITFLPLGLPNIDGLPCGAETFSDVSPSVAHLLILAFFRLRKHVESILIDLRPDFIFFDHAHWVPSFASEVGIKSIAYITSGAASTAYITVPSRNIHNDDHKTRLSLMDPPLDFPPNSPLKLHSHEVEDAIPFWAEKNEGNGGLTTHQLVVNSLTECDLICIRTRREIEGSYCDYLEFQYKKPILLTGLLLPDQTQISTSLEERWDNWLGSFKTGSVIYCAFGSQIILSKDQIQELLLGIELTGLPFLVALKPPVGFDTVDDALPDGFKVRVGGRGLVHGGWVQQPKILANKSVGCFVSHCGFGSASESLLNNVQLVLMPQLDDQYLTSRLLSGELKVAVEVEKKEHGGSWFSKESICGAIKMVMDEDSKTGLEIKANHSNLRDLLSRQGLESSYMDNFINKLHDEIKK